MRRLFTSFGLTVTLLPGPAGAEPEPEPEPPPAWRFRKRDRPVKVVSLAGSVGAFPRHSYSRQIENICAAVEVKNLSKTGLGAWALKKRFKEQVLENRNLNLRREGREYWLLVGGGLNSVAMPERSARYFRDLFVLAHRRGMKVVGLTLTPWGDGRDRRWRTPVSALKYFRNTRKVVDFIMGRLEPREALGRYTSKRPQGSQPAWEPAERPDVAIDLYDSRMRDRNAAPLDEAETRAALERDRNWKKAHAALGPEPRATKLAEDARQAAQIPRWYMRPELRAFDHIHPNADGHRLIAQIACPSLPASWQCTCG